MMEDGAMKRCTIGMIALVLLLSGMFILPGMDAQAASDERRRGYSSLETQRKRGCWTNLGTGLAGTRRIPETNAK